MTGETKTFRHPFKGRVYDGEQIHGHIGGFAAIATIHHDHDMGAPWDEHDGHGPVSEWRPRNSKRPGERILHQESGGSCRFYDWQAAIELAHKEGWGTSDGRQEGETLRAYRARAVEEDFKHLRAWRNDEWTWVGVDVRLYIDGVPVTDEYNHALWGIESNSPDYLTEVAEERAQEALAAVQSKMAVRPLGVFGGVACELIELDAEYLRVGGKVLQIDSVLDDPEAFEGETWDCLRAALRLLGYNPQE